jgi:hypothetical protein
MNHTDQQELLKDFSGAAASYFAQVRIPASIVTGSSLGALFALGNFSKQGDRTSLELLLIKLYRLLAWASFILSLNANLISTMVSTTILFQQFDPMADNVWSLLQREFNFEFVSVYWSMTVSLLLFIAIVTVRLMLELNLVTDPKRHDTARFVGFSAMALTCHLLSYINESLCPWSNLWEMTLGLFWMILEQCWKQPTVMRSISLVCSIISITFGIKSATASNTPTNTAEKDKKE